MTELIRKPKVLSKAQLELKQTISRGNIVEETDFYRLPYLQAIIKETFRLHPPFPLLVPRKTPAEVKIGEFMVPKRGHKC